MKETYLRIILLTKYSKIQFDKKKLTEILWGTYNQLLTKIKYKDKQKFTPIEWWAFENKLVTCYLGYWIETEYLHR